MYLNELRHMYTGYMQICGALSSARVNTRTRFETLAVFLNVCVFIYNLNIYIVQILCTV